MKTTHHIRLLSSPLNPQHVQGVVVKITPKSPEHVHIVLDPHQIQHHSTLPFRGLIRLRNVSTFFTKTLQPGDHMRAKLSLTPLPLPWSPGGYPLTQHLYFEGLAAEGKLEGSFRILQKEPPSSFSLWRQRHRQKLKDHIFKTFAPPFDGIVLALTLGEKAAIPSHIKEDFALSGLAHLLAISGLHMALLMGVVFFCVRRALSLTPYAEFNDTKPLAGIIAFLVLSYYLFLCFESVSARRAYIMACFILGGFFLRRPPFSLKTLFATGIGLLCLWPASLILPSFQLSFSAVLGLFLAYQLPLLQQSARSSLLYKLVRALCVLALTSLVVGIATLPLILKTFQQAPLLSLLANMVAIPGMSFVVMPLILLSLPFFWIGAGNLIAPALSSSLSLLLSWAHQISSFEQSFIAVPPPPGWALGLCFLGACFSICYPYRLWRGGFAFFFIGGCGLFMGEAPTLLLSPKKPYYGICQDHCLYVHGGHQTFAPVGNWHKRTGHAAVTLLSLKDGASLQNYAWDSEGGKLTLGHSRFLFLQDRSLHRSDLIQRGDFTLTRFPVKSRKLSLSIADLKKLGEIEISVKGDKLIFSSAMLLMGERPWNPYRQHWKSYLQRFKKTNFHVITPFPGS